MVVTGRQANNQVFNGYLVLEELENQGQISIRDAINADLAGLIPASNLPTAVAAWAVNVKILDYNISAVGTVAGFPLRAKFGSITYYSVATFLTTEFIQHEIHTFSPQRCVVLPITYNDVPYASADIPSFTVVDSYSTATGYMSSAGLFLGFGSLSGATGFYYDLAISAVANITIPYVVRFIDQNPNADSITHLLLNF